MREGIDRKRLVFKDDYVYLNRNMVLYEHSAEMYNLLLESFKREDLHQYPDMASTYRALGDHLNVSTDKICITRGVEGAIKQAFETLNLFGESVGLLLPNYAMYHVYAKIYGANLVPVEGEAPDYKITVEQIKEIIPRVKVLFLDNPKTHLPNHFTHEELDQIVEYCKIYGVILFLDEVYAGWEYETYLPKLGRHNNLIISSSFSKSGFPSIKTGWSVANEKLKKQLETTRLSYELDYFSCKSLEFIIKNKDYLDALKAHVLNIKHRWYKELLKNKEFKIYSSKAYVLRLFSEDKELVKKTYHNLYLKKIVVNLINDTNLVFSVSTCKEVERIIFNELKSK